MSKSRDIADSAATINFIDTVTSNVQDQIDNIDPLPSQTGNAGKYLTTDGTNDSWGEVAAGGGLTSMQVITSTGTWTKPVGISKIRVTVIGGGGGGAGTTNNGWLSGGAGGGAAIKIINVSAIASESVTIGAGAAGGTAGGGIGGTGGTSSFGAHCSATGGAGGRNFNDSATGGIGSSGDLNIRGGYGGLGANNTARPGPSGGGSSYLGPGGAPKTYSNNVGNDGEAYGSGGGAGVYQNSDRAGGAGVSGVVIVEEFV